MSNRFHTHSERRKILVDDFLTGKDVYQDSTYKQLMIDMLFEDVLESNDLKELVTVWGLEGHKGYKNMSISELEDEVFECFEEDILDYYGCNTREDISFIIKKEKNAIGKWVILGRKL